LIVRQPKLIGSLAAVSLLTFGGTALAVGPAAHLAALKDCGRLSVAFGGVGKPPKGVPSGANPEIDAFRVSGQLGCKTVRSVMQAYENNASSTLTANKPPAPGWSCKYNRKAQGAVCRMGANVIEDQLVWKKHGRLVGPKPHKP
jgi:hypothetical protein